MKDEIRQKLIELAVNEFTLEEMLEEAAQRLIEYTQEEGITSFGRVNGRLYGYGKLI
jgi:hypothetical protein